MVPLPLLTSSLPSKPIKLALLGNSGDGKTGALASLANAGYRLAVFDFDGGLDIFVFSQDHA